MMAWYVFALVDRVPSGPPGRGLSSRLAVRRVPGGLLVVERRADVPPVEFGTLQQHQAVVARLAERVPAILPVRFGTLLEASEIEEALEERDDEIAEAFDLVRHRVQFTWRKSARGRREERGFERRSGSERGWGPASAEKSRQKAGAVSGADYLRRAARAASPAAPAAFRRLRSTLAPLVAVERYQPATAAVPESLYHLVEKPAASRYAAVADEFREANPQFTMTGPFPPFAFAPEVL